ncbi:MAG TPA: threonine--tRNA ligase [Mollicutes bacterium]|nr:threonine--tRNA ligase [Mollicutes bacterium]
MINIKENEKLNVLNHSCAHLLAHAVKRLYPEALFWVGPVIEDGFYYDIDLGDNVIKEEDLERIEREMKRISKDNKRITRIELSKTDALEMFKDDPYKLDLIENMEESTNITAYKQDDFIDLCRGPHMETTRDMRHFKLLKVSGAYFKGDSKNKMLQRIYGICFEEEQDLNDYLNFLEEAKKRDHRRLGKDLDLFCFSDLVGPGLPLFTPKGTIIKDELQKEIEKICRKYGFQKVSTPHLANIKLYEISGHAAKFSEELFHVTSEKGHEMVMKPVQCPHQTQIYASKIRSYRDLPIRYMESEKQYRAEMPGAVSGLSRVYAITCEDGHSFCRVDQVKQEVINMCNIVKDFYSNLGLWGNHWVSLSVRDYDAPEKYIGDPKDWDICEKMLEEVSNELGLNAKRCEGEAALYGPKLDFMFKDAMGREIQIPTVQLDFATPKRFDLTYINSDGEKEHPVMVHRAILGSYERFFVLLLEHFAGAFPLWLAPVQVNIIPVNNEYHLEYANEIKDLLMNNEIRVELDDRGEKLGYKMRESQTNKIPYTLILGDKERDNNNVSYRKYGSEETVTVTKDEFVSIIIDQINNRK